MYLKYFDMAQKVFSKIFFFFSEGYRFLISSSDENDFVTLNSIINGKYLAKLTPFLQKQNVGLNSYFWVCRHLSVPECSPGKLIWVTVDGANLDYIPDRRPPSPVRDRRGWLLTGDGRTKRWEITKRDTRYTENYPMSHWEMGDFPCLFIKSIRLEDHSRAMMFPSSFRSCCSE